MTTLAKKVFVLITQEILPRSKKFKITRNQAISLVCPKTLALIAICEVNDHITRKEVRDILDKYFQEYVDNFNVT